MNLATQFAAASILRKTVSEAIALVVEASAILSPDNLNDTMSGEGMTGTDERWLSSSP